MQISCTACGVIGIGAEDYRDWLKTDSIKDKQIPALRHALARMTLDHSRPVIKLEMLKRIVSDANMPRPSEQLVNFVVWLGNSLEGRPNEPYEFNIRRAIAIIGSNNKDGFRWIVDQAHRKSLISQTQPIFTGLNWSIGLTFEGWDKYFALQEVRRDSRTAFMAMDFNEQLIREAYDNCFRPAVAATGFDLRTVSEKQKAGLIDNRLRVEIRNAKFLIADLTHENRGAYWEAGFAEGLGKHVIYTCEKAKFEKDKTHFDTSHHLTVIWESDNLSEAAEQLKAVIRNTLPDDAKMSDN